jgi:hypothetical protein
MLSRNLIGVSIAALFTAGTTLASGAPLSMAPVSTQTTPYVQTVDCAVGAHIGPLGGCIVGTDNPPPAPVVIERRAVDAPDPDVTTQKTITQDANGCATKSVTQTDSAGNSETRTRSNC